jgi:hypothetical protein
MIWAILAILGVPLWLIAIVLYSLLRVRSSVRKAPGSIPCKIRIVEGHERWLKDKFPRYVQRAVWVHDVLVVYGGNPFLTRTFVLGVVGLAMAPQPASTPVKRITDASTFRFRVDSGAVAELAATKTDVAALLGPFPAVPASAPAAPRS